MIGSGVSRASDFLKANTPTPKMQIILKTPSKARKRNGEDRICKSPVYRETHTL
jgi:hypothetical protein